MFIGAELYYPYIYSKMVISNNWNLTLSSLNSATMSAIIMSNNGLLWIHKGLLVCNIIKDKIDRR